MPVINKILSRITILYYIFIAVLMTDFAYSFSIGFLDGFNSGHEQASQMAEANPEGLIVAAIWSLVSIAVFFWMIVQFIILMVSLGRSVARKNIFNLRTVHHINRYAMTYAFWLAALFIGHFIKESATLELHDVVGNVLSGSATIVMLLLFAQVLKIGNILKAETDLTI